MTKAAESECNRFLDSFVPKLADLEAKANEASWELLTNSSPEAESRCAEFATELELHFTDREAFLQAAALSRKPIDDPLLKRQFDILGRKFRENVLLPRELIGEITEKEVATERAFTEFRALLGGHEVDDNEIRSVLQTSENIAERQEAWRASKQVGDTLAPRVKELAKLRNHAARIAGFENYFEMAYTLDELNPRHVMALFSSAIHDSEISWQKVLVEIEAQQAGRFKVDTNKLGPWAWSEPFSQEDPMFSSEDGSRIIAGHNLIKATTDFFTGIGLDITQVIQSSDLFSRNGKNPHAYCFDMNRSGDVRILANIVPTHGWLETLWHECGHGAEFLGHNPNLPWLLRASAHTLTTEAMAELSGSFASRPEILSALFETKHADRNTLLGLAKSHIVGQLVFSRWAMVVVSFEKHLYENPDADHQAAWWNLVERYQGIRRPENREGCNDWAAKVHISTAPCYYQNYFLAHLFRSQIAEGLESTFSGNIYGNPLVGKFLNDSFFSYGASLPWPELIERVSGKPLGTDSWAREISI